MNETPKEDGEIRKLTGEGREGKGGTEGKGHRVQPEGSRYERAREQEGRAHQKKKSDRDKKKNGGGIQRKLTVCFSEKRYERKRERKEREESTAACDPVRINF